MAAQGNTVEAVKEALFLLRRVMPRAGNSPVDLNTFDIQAGARYERFYSNRLFSYLNDPEFSSKYGLSADAVNEYLRTDPDVAARYFSKPWNDEMGFTPEQAIAKGFALKDKDGNLIYRDAAGNEVRIKPVPGPDDNNLFNDKGETVPKALLTLQVRSFLAIDANGYINQTDPQGRMIPTEITRNGQKIKVYNALGTIYSGPDSMARLVAEVAAQKMIAAMGITDKSFLKKMRGLDGLLSKSAREDLKAELNLTEDMETPGGNFALYKKLAGLPKDKLREKLEPLVRAQNSQQPVPPEELPAMDPKFGKETADEKSIRLAARDKIIKANEEKDKQNQEALQNYLQVFASLRTLEDGGLRDILDHTDMSRIPGLLFEGLIRPGLSLAAGLSNERPWQADIGYDKNRLWDKVGLGEVYDKLTKDIYHDQRVTMDFGVTKDSLIAGVGRADPDFKNILEKMGLPDRLDIQDFHKVSTVLYAYQVLKHEGMMGAAGAADRLVELYKGGAGLNPEERSAVTKSMNGQHYSDKPPLMLNPKYDLPLLQFAYKQGESDADRKIAAAQHTSWFQNAFDIPVEVPGFSGVKSTLPPEQAVRKFWLFEAEHLGFPRDVLERRVSDDDLNKLPGVAKGTRYMDLSFEQTVAFFESEGKGAAVRQKMVEIFENETAATFWNRNGFDAEYAVMYKGKMKDVVLAGVADGTIKVPPAQRPAVLFKDDAALVGGNPAKSPSQFTDGPSVTPLNR